MSFLIKLLPNFSLFWKYVFYQIWTVQPALRNSQIYKKTTPMPKKDSSTGVLLYILRNF